nr:hypothetical protein [Tanacetum cinerariifolium]
MPTSRQSLNVAAIEQLITQHVTEAMEAYKANQNNQKRNGNPNVNVGSVVLVARECTYQDFMKSQPLNFKGTKRVVRLTRWIEKMETEGVVRLTRWIERWRLKEFALTWWNLHKRTIVTDAAYGMTWKALMKLLTEVYYLRNEIRKMETELWNLAVKDNALTAYTQRFQELILCTKMVPEEEDRVEMFIGG